MNLMLTAGLVFALGDFAGLAYPHYFYFWLLGLGGSGLGSIVYFFRKTKSSIFLISCLLLIFMAGALVGAKANEPLPSFWLSWEQQPRWVSGDIVYGSVQERKYGAWTFTFQEKTTGRQLKVLVKQWPPGKAIPTYGKLELYCQVEPLQYFANPGTLDREFYGKVHNLWGQTAVEATALKLLPSPKPWQWPLTIFHQKVQALLTQAMSPADGAILKGMTLGGTKDIPEDTLADFSTVGVMHLLAVSGTHVAVLTGALLAVLQSLGVPNAWATLLTVLSLLIYGLLCGFQPSVWRAVLMGLFYLGGRLGENPGDKGAILGAALFMLLLVKPWWLFSIGFQLSFGATAGLIYLLPGLQSRLTKFLPRYVAFGLALALAAQLPMVPLLLYYFHRLSLVSLLTNLFVVPMLSVVVVMTMAGILLSFLWLIGGKLVLVCTSQLLGVALFMIENLAKIPLAAINVQPWPWGFIILYYVFLGAVFQLYPWINLTTQNRKRVIIFCLVIFSLGQGYLYLKPQAFTAYFLSVGQGDSALLVTPGKETILIDTGGLGENYDTGQRIIVPVLRYLGMEKVDILLLSHGHHDHAGGAAGVAKCFPIEKVLLPRETPSADVAALLRQLGTKTKVETMWTGQKVNLGTCSLEMLDIPTVKGDNSNESCALVKVSHLGHSILFTGDALAEQEFNALDKDIASTVLKVSHHGSASSSCEEFLRKVRPSLAIISCGRRNRFGHPHGEVLGRFRQLGIKVLRTDEQGAIQVTLTKKGINYNFCKKAKTCL